MQYFSTNKRSPLVDFKEATLRGLAPDKGLYFPEKIPQLNWNFINDIEQYSNDAIAYHIIQPYVGNTIPDEILFQIVSETIDFPLPLVQINDRMASLELFHGPTMAFKDIGARFMSRCLGYFAAERNKKATVLVATSGDTGGAVASGFYETPGVDVVILYPSGKVSTVQEQQLNMPGRNIHPIEVEGSFDDCQQLVKQAFADSALTQQLFLTSANSINIARWLPQQFYYFFAYKQWKDKNHPPVIAVPSGNFGNICAGLLAHQSGLPVQHFIAACNANKVVTEYLQHQQYQPQPAIPTLSNAMDVGDPSNFIRVLELFHHSFNALTNVLSSESINDEATRDTIKHVYNEYQYLLDPHGAVAYRALENYLEQHPEAKGIFLETAHPVKFPEVVYQATGVHFEAGSGTDIKKSIPMPADYQSLSNFLTALPQ